jgi:hypothetical protein
MSDSLGTYSFLPWLRRGLMTAATPAAPGQLRATVTVDLMLHGDKIGGGDLTRPVHRAVQLYGPSDATPLEEKDIVRTEPRPWITNFEPNYLAFIEFYDEGQPWLYTPAAPDANQRLAPWLTLLVLTDDEFQEGQAKRKSPYITVSDPKVFPAASELWAWAHVHVNRDLNPAGKTVNDDMSQVLPRFEAAMRDNPDLGLSRLLCPRHLAPGTGYHAFVVPTFETGRLWGLGRDPSVSPAATHVSWSDYPARSGEEPGAFPFYYRWYFRTGTVGDFEYLVRLLQPRLVPPQVGQRDIDTQRPLVGLPGIDVPGLHGVLRLGGALKVPDANLDPAQLAQARQYEDWDSPFPHPFQAAQAALIDLADDYLAGAAGGPDPIITPPLYGRWHAQTSRLLEVTTPPTRDNWVHELNLDPRFRVPAGFGTSVVQDHQEEYMAAAWRQIGAVLDANRRIRFGHLAREVAGSMHRRHLAAQLAADPGRVLALTAPLLPRLMDGAVTAATRIAASLVATGPLSTAMRRVARPGARLTRVMGGRARLDRLLPQIALGKALAARPKQAPAGTLTTDMLSAKFDKARGTIAWLMLANEAVDPAIVDRLPPVPDFKLIVPPTRAVPPFHPGGEDNRTGSRFKNGMRGNAELFRASEVAGREPARAPLDVHGLAAQAIDQLHPDRTVPRRVLAGLAVPERFRPRVVEQFREVMAYPEFDVPMYQPLAKRSAELFVPNLNLIPPDTITLLETNQRFIESYMVGLNHEMARELLWREYPTDQQGSYFRQFWDPAPQLSQPGESAGHRRERLRDIPPLHRWPLLSELGSHDQREAVPGSAEEELVLVIRGELLKRYPTAVIYAQRAQWPRKPDGSIDLDAERSLVDLSAAEELAPPATKLRTPLYEAKVEPDIYFFGFDLTAAAARGDDPVTTPDPDPGWFFVLRERPGEPRFGLDIKRTGGLNVWNDLAWDDVAPAPATFIAVGSAAPARTLAEPTAAEGIEKHPQWVDDQELHWGPDLRSSEVAYILYQAPVLVAVHAQEMLGHG